MPTIAVTCTRCGDEFEPDRQAIAAGHWHTCPACRESEAPWKRETPMEADIPCSPGYPMQSKPDPRS